jgi:hypothetical protein
MIFVSIILIAIASYFIFFKKTYTAISPVLYGSEIKKVIRGEKSIYNLELGKLNPIHQLILEENLHSLTEGEVKESLYKFTDLINKNSNDISLKLYIISSILERIELGLDDENTQKFLKQWFPIEVHTSSEINDILIDLIEARYKLSQNQTNEAKTILSEIIKRSPSEGFAYLYLSKAFLKNCELKAARNTIPFAISLLNNKRSNAYNTLSEIFIKSNKLDTAKLLIRSTLSRFPADLQTHITALRFYNINQFDEYQKELDKLRVLYSDDNQLQAKLLDSNFIKLSKCKETSLINKTSLSFQLNKLLDSLISNEPQNNALKTVKNFIQNKSIPIVISGSQSESHSNNSPELQDLSIEITNENKQKQGLKKRIKNNSRLLQYLVHWKTQPNKFFEKYNPNSFKTQDSARFIETWIDKDDITHKQSVYFDNKGLWKMVGLLERSKSSTQDLLGLVLKERAREAGDPLATDSDICPGFRNFNGYLWQHLDMIELVAQFKGRENQVRLLRINPLRYPEAISVCEYLKEILPNTSN